MKDFFGCVGVVWCSVDWMKKKERKKEVVKER